MRDESKKSILVKVYVRYICVCVCVYIYIYIYIVYIRTYIVYIRIYIVYISIYIYIYIFIRKIRKSERAKNTKIFQQKTFNKYSTIKHKYNLFMYVYNICKL